MQLRWLKFIFVICLIACGGGGGGSGGGGSGGLPDQSTNQPIILPAIVGYGDVDYYLLRINGNLETVESPFEYIIDGYPEGMYFFQIQSVRNGQPDYPVNFNLIVIEEDEIMSYEIFPKNWEENFDQENLILP